MDLSDDTGWRDAKTDPPPKDGTKLDLLFPYPRGRTIDCFWGGHPLHHGDLWVWRTPTWNGPDLLPEEKWSVSCYPNMEPTHWRFPPPPPQEPNTP